MRAGMVNGNELETDRTGLTLFEPDCWRLHEVARVIAAGRGHHAARRPLEAIRQQNLPALTSTASTASTPALPQHAQGLEARSRRDATASQAVTSSFPSSACHKQGCKRACRSRQARVLLAHPERLRCPRPGLSSTRNVLWTIRRAKSRTTGSGAACKARQWTGPADRCSLHRARSACREHGRTHAGDAAREPLVSGSALPPRARPSTGERAPPHRPKRLARQMDRSACAPPGSDIEAGPLPLRVFLRDLLASRRASPDSAYARLSADGRAEFTPALVYHLARILQENALDLLGS